MGKTSKYPSSIIMKLLLAIFALVAATSASDIGPVIINKCATCPTLQAVIAVPSIVVDVNLTLLGLVHLYVDVDVDCSIIAAAISVATEKSLKTTTSGGIVSFAIDIEAAVIADLNVNANLVVKILGGITIGVGACVIVIADLVVDISVTGTYPVGSPASCTILTVDVVLSTSGCSYGPISGASIISIVLGLVGNTVLGLVFAAIQLLLKNCLTGCL